MVSASRKGLRLPLRSALFGEGGSDWRPCIVVRKSMKDSCDIQIDGRRGRETQDDMEETDGE